VKEQCSARFGEWNVAQFIDDNAMGLAELADDFTGFTDDAGSKRMLLLPGGRMPALTRVYKTF